MQYQVWAIDEVSPTIYGRAFPVGKPTTKAAAERSAARHNVRPAWQGHTTRRVALPVGETPPEYVENTSAEWDPITVEDLRRDRAM